MVPRGSWTETRFSSKQDALRIAIHEQSRRGIDIVSDGEQTRQHFVTTFIEHLSGVDFEQRKTVRIRDRYDASVPTVVGAVRRERPVFVEDAKFLRATTDRPIKWTLPGPMTMVDTLFDDHYKSREKLAWEFAAILNQEAKELEAAGVDIIQFDEPAFNVFLDEVKDWGVAALERAAEGLRAETAVHICYGYGIKANTDWKATLGSQWRQYEETFPLLQNSSIDIISLESQNSHVPMDLIELLRGKKVMLGGAIDVASETIETPEEVADTLRNALQFVDADKLIPSSNCGMAPFPRDVALAKLSASAQGRESFARNSSAPHPRCPNDVSCLSHRHLAGGAPKKSFPQSLSADEFKALFRGHPGGVAVITADAGEGPVALTVSSVVSVSAEPPLLIFSVSALSSASEVLSRAETVVVHLLDAHDVDLAKFGATPGADRFDQTHRWSALATGEAVYDDVRAGCAAPSSIAWRWGGLPQSSPFTPWSRA